MKPVSQLLVLFRPREEADVANSILSHNRCGTFDLAPIASHGRHDSCITFRVFGDVLSLTFQAFREPVPLMAKVYLGYFRKPMTFVKETVFNNPLAVLFLRSYNLEVETHPPPSASFSEPTRLVFDLVEGGMR